MFNPMLNLSLSMMEGQQVVWLRLLCIGQGGKGAEREAERMVSEKIDAAVHAGIMLATGATPAAIARHYQRKVRANRIRLSR